MKIRLIDPTGVLMKEPRQCSQPLADITGKRAGFLFNQHATAKSFWASLEHKVENDYAPSAIGRLYKDNTWAPAPQAEINRLMQETDYVLVGLGA